MRKRTKITLLALCGILTSTTVSYHYAVHTSVCAAENILSVKVKEDAVFFVNQTITADYFDFSINGSIVNEQNITITPSIFTSEGTHEITITYTTKNAAYQQKMNIDVKNVAADHIELASDDITLVKNQTITVASLPEVYMFYTDGSKKVVTDYKTNMDWEKGILEISSSGVSIKKNVNIIDSKISYIQVVAKKSVIPADYTFVPADFEVTAYFTNGMSMIVNDYQIQPYTLVDGGETVITIKYMTVSSSFIVRGTAPLKTPTPAPTLDPNATEIPYDNPIGVTPIPSVPATTPTVNATAPAATNATVQPNTNTVIITTPTAAPTEEPVTITLERTSIKQGIGEKIKVNVKTVPKATVSLHSKNKKVATITKNGYIKGMSQGNTEISVQAGISKATISVNVLPAPSKIGLTSDLKTKVNCTLKKGKTLKIPIFFNKGAYSNKISFKSSNKKVVSVSNKGQIKAKSKGKATIRITTFNLKKAYIKVLVN